LLKSIQNLPAMFNEGRLVDLPAPLPAVGARRITDPLLTANTSDANTESLLCLTDWHSQTLPARGFGRGLLLGSALQFIARLLMTRKSEFCRYSSLLLLPLTRGYQHPPFPSAVDVSAGFVGAGTQRRIAIRSVVSSTRGKQQPRRSHS
jgi:hypothetical protein